jgi:DNA-binding NarL/FixJ family response regulator
MLSVHDESDYVDAAFDAGASGYVVKTGAPQELIPAIESVLTGGSYRSPATGRSG